MLLLALPILDTLSVMVQRIDEGRSPFSADKNHIHHKLLALGFGHHEAVMVIYIVQALLFTLAYFMRFESDLTILFVLSAFFVLSIAGLQIAARSGWRLGGANPVSSESRLSKVFTGLLQPKLLPRISIFAIATAISLYAMLIVLKAAVLSSDVRALLMGLLAVTCGLLLILRAGPLSFVEKAALYVTATVLVYLDAMIPAPDHIMSILTWTAVSIAAAATAIRLRLLSDRRFQLTPLDLIVLFMALVVPSLPGSFSLPLGGALTIAKLLIVLYAIEILVSRTEGRTVWLRIGIASVLAGLVIRPFIAI
jgi:UDP-GlcNAc:undecaprenyl-phosphate GlcNAc-1-phosphate transferase